MSAKQAKQAMQSAAQTVKDAVASAKDAVADVLALALDLSDGDGERAIGHRVTAKSETVLENEVTVPASILPAAALLARVMIERLPFGDEPCLNWEMGIWNGIAGGSVPVGGSTLSPDARKALSRFLDSDEIRNASGAQSAYKAPGKQGQGSDPNAGKHRYDSAGNCLRVIVYGIVTGQMTVDRKARTGTLPVGARLIKPSTHGRRANVPADERTNDGINGAESEGESAE